MNILLTNDDGIEAMGITALYDAFLDRGYQVIVVAPRYEQSAKSHAVTTRDPLRIERRGELSFSLTGTPADCVIMANEYILPEYAPHIKVDLVVSGINSGQNLCDDILYSGTVAGAVEGACYGIKSLAISLAHPNPDRYDTAVKALLSLLDDGITDYIGHRKILNINVPHIDFEQIKGYKVCQAGFHRYQNIIQKQIDHRGNEIFWLGGANPRLEDSKNEIDVKAVKDGYVSISPLKIDLNDYDMIAQMKTRSR
jgi:5'-nucleotidase